MNWSLTCQCSGGEEKVSSPSIIRTLLLSWGTWPASSKWPSVSVTMSRCKTLCWCAVSAPCLYIMLPDYKERIGAKCQFLIEPKPKEPCRHQYDYGNGPTFKPVPSGNLTVLKLLSVWLFRSTDAMSVIGFLKHYGLESHFKLNIEPNHTTLAGHSYEHDIIMASAWDIRCNVDSAASRFGHNIINTHVPVILTCWWTGSACWVRLTQTLVLLTWGGTQTSFRWTSGTRPSSWKWASLNV